MDPNNKETPITKYLANLERRKSIFMAPSPLDSTPSPTATSPPKTIRTRGPQGIQMKLSFDDTFFSGQDGDESILHISPQGSSKRRRTSSIFTDYRGDSEELEQKNSELERLLRQTQAELIDCRASYTRLDQVNIEMRRNHAEKIINLENAQDEMKIKCKNAVERAESLEKQLLKYQRKESELKTEFQSQRSSLNSKYTALEEKISGLQKENFQLNQKITQESIKAEQARRKLQTEFDEVEKGAEKWVMDSQVLKDQLSLAQAQLLKCQAELKISQVDAIKYQEVKNKYENALNANEAVTTDTLMLQERVKKYENLYVKEQFQTSNVMKVMKKVQDENNILRSTIRSEMILQEQVMNFESQISYMKKELVEKGAIEAERNVLRNEVKAWKSVAFQVDSSCTTPLSFETMLRQNQNMLLELKHENTNLKYSGENSARLVVTLQAEGVLLRDQLKVLKEEKEKLTLEHKKISRRMVLLVKDRDGLKELKESYEKEFDGLISEPLKDRISELEGIVADYEALLSDDANSKKPCEECEQRAAQLSSLKSQLENTEREKEKLSLTLAEFNQTYTEDPTTGIKIVSFGNNPSMLSIEARLKECLAENERLKEKVREYEDTTIVVGGGPSDAALAQEKRKLEDQLRALERKHQILADAYDYETVQLQNACNKLFGYHVTMVPAEAETRPQLRIQSIYSSDPDDVFIFQDLPNTTDMMLLDTPILEHFRDDIQRYLTESCSIPGFLSAVTITYVQGQTMSQSSQESTAEPTPPADETMRIMSVHTLAQDENRPSVPQLEPIDYESDEEDVEDERPMLDEEELPEEEEFEDRVDEEEEDDDDEEEDIYADMDVTRRRVHHDDEEEEDEDSDDCVTLD